MPSLPSPAIVVMCVGVCLCSSSEEHPSVLHSADICLKPPPPPPGSPPPDAVEYDVIETPASKSVRFLDAASAIHDPSSEDSSADEEEGDEEAEEEEERDLDKDVNIGKNKALDSAKTDLSLRPFASHPSALLPAQPLPTPAVPPPLFPQAFPPSRYAFPPGHPVGPPPRYDGPPPRPLMPSQVQSGAVLSAPPTRAQQDSGSGGVADTASGTRSAIISAQPRLRNMTAEVTKFMPTSLRVRRDQPKATKPKLKVNTATQEPTHHQPISGRTAQAVAGVHVQGDAYDSFMHEMQGLL